MSSFLDGDVCAYNIDSDIVCYWCLPQGEFPPASSMIMARDLPIESICCGCNKVFVRSDNNYFMWSKLDNLEVMRIAIKEET